MYQIDKGLREYAEPLMESTREQLAAYVDPIDIFIHNLHVAEVLEEELELSDTDAKHVVGVMMKELLEEFSKDEDWVKGLRELDEYE